MVDDEDDVLRHDGGAPVERALDALEQLHQPTDGQHPGLGHGLAHVLVQAEDRPHHVADGVGQQQTLHGGRQRRNAMTKFSLCWIRRPPYREDGGEID